MNLGFTIKRVFKDASFIAMLAAIIVISFLAYKAGENIKTPPYGFTCLASGPDAQRICDEFEAAGFVSCESEDKLKEEIAAAHLDCGIIVNEKIDRLMDVAHSEENIDDIDMEGSLTIVTSPETLLPELCRVQAVSVLTAVYAPYVTYDALRDVVDYDTVKSAYDGMLDEGALFGFRIESAAGTFVINEARSRNLFKGALAILVFIAAWLGCCRPAYRHARDIEKRMSFGRAVPRVMLPEILVRGVMILAATVLTCIAAGQSDLITVSMAYTGITVASGILAVIVLPDAWLLVVTVFVMILSLGLCPMFTDLADLIPALATIRRFLIPYLMWLL